MVDQNRVTRRSVLRAGGVVLGAGWLSSASVAAESRTSGEELESAEPLPPADATDIAPDLEIVPASEVTPDQETGIGPGAQLFITREDTDGVAGCTANFVWRGADGTLYLGAAGHCFLPGSAAASRSAGGEYDTSQVTTKVCLDCAFGGAAGLQGVRGRVVELGGVAYARQTQDGVGVGNDFGLVEIPAAAEKLVSPAVPTFGGPTTEGAVDEGEPVCQYGSGVVFGETFLTKGRTGTGLGHDPDAGSWTAALPASPGDSGAAVVSCRPTTTGLQGVEAAGILTHVTSSGTAGTNQAAAERLATQADLDIEPVLV